MEGSSGIVRFGLLGFGKVARTRFLPSLARLVSVRLTALGTRDPSRVRAEDLPLAGPPRLLRYEHLVREGRNLVDAVYIALPNDMHEEWTLRCAEAGLHVLCEKPLATDSAAAQRCAQKCRERGVLLAEAFMYRHAPRHHRVRDLIQSGQLGHVHLLEVSFSYVLEDQTNIRLRADRQGGALRDVGCYGIDLARFLLGREPEGVTACGLWGEHSGVDELAAVILGFPPGTAAVVTASTHLARLHAYRVRGVYGTITVPNAFVPGDDSPTQILIEDAGGERRVEDFLPFAAFTAEVAHFARAARANDRALLAPAEDGVANAEVLEAAIRSMSQGRCMNVLRSQV